MSNLSRRNFLKSTAALAATGALIGPLAACKNFNVNTKSGHSKVMKMRVSSQELELKHTFNITGFSRDVAYAILVEIEYDGVIGYGEGGLPPYMIGQNIETATAFLNKIDLAQFSSPFQIDEILTYVDGIEPGFTCPKSAFDGALHDLVGKLLDKPLYTLWGYNKENTPNTSLSIGFDTEEMIRQKVEEALPYKIIKLKLGVDHDTDRLLVNTVRSATDKPIVVDVNQGWEDKHYVLEMIHWLKEKGVVFVEQPMHKSIIDDMAWVTERSPLPTIADESFQRLTDMPRLHGAFHGVNIKLIKCGGLREANKIIATAEALGMKLMVGSTIESGLAITAAAHIAPKMDYADLDGNLLISNDGYKGMEIVNGKITLNDLPGLGVTKI
ncbi:MAG: dipeptide epimerase [Bacteroidales bacterium]